MNERKIKVLITFKKNGENGGPYVSHRRLMESQLKTIYEFVPYYMPKTRELLNPSTLHREIVNIRAINPDIFHFSGLLLEGFASCVVAILAGCTKRVCAIHGSTADNVFQNTIVRRIIINMENWTLRHSSVCYGVSEFVCSWNRVKKFGKCFGYIYNLADNDKANYRNIRDELGLNENSIIVVSTSRIEKDKGYDTLIEAASLVNKAGFSDVHFVIVGNGSYLEIIKKKAIHLEIAENVHFLGYRKDIADILESSDIFLLCTLHETLCMSIVEAANHNLPIISTFVGGIPEIVQNGVSGFLVPPSDVARVEQSLILLIKNRDLCKQMGKYGKDIIQNKFNEIEIIKKVDQMYSKLIED